MTLNNNHNWRSFPQEMLEARTKAEMFKEMRKDSMVPDQRIAKDIGWGFAALVAFTTIMMFLADHGELPPAEYCANTVISKLSPYQTYQLTGGSWPNHKRSEVVAWCASNPVDWERDTISARQYPEYPSTPDMIIE